LLPNLKQTDVVWRHVTEYAAESFHVLHMDSMSDDALLNQLLSPHLCQVIPFFEQQSEKENVTLCYHQLSSKLMLFGGMPKI
jgi:hypothetical protein